MVEKKYRAGIVGCGAISRAHAKMYKEHGMVDLVTASDIISPVLKRFSEEFSVSSTYTDYREMLDKEDLDLVSVCTWHGTHAEITIAAAERRVKGVFCEKPMSVNLGQADAMIEACEKTGTKLTVEHNRRYDPVNMEARKLIKEGSIGRPLMVLSRTSGGLLNWGTHMIDHARYLLGDPETEWVIGQVERKTDRYERRVRIEDLCTSLVYFSSGTRFLLECDLPGPEFPTGPNSTLVYGSDGMLIPTSGKVLLLNDKSGWQEIEPAGSGSLTHLGELIAWMEGRIGDHRCSGMQARYTMEIMMSTYESVRIKGLVRMPLKTRENPLEKMIEDGTLPVEKPGKYDIRIPSPFWDDEMKKAYESLKRGVV